MLYGNEMVIVFVYYLTRVVQLMQKVWILEKNVSLLFLLDLFLHIPVFVHLEGGCFGREVTVAQMKRLNKVIVPPPFIH